MHDAEALSKIVLMYLLRWTRDLSFASMFARALDINHLNHTYIYRLYDDGDLRYRDINSDYCVGL